MVSSAPDLISRILRRERLIVAISLLLLIALSWWYLVSGAGVANIMTGMQPSMGALVIMWWLMMVAMMLPSAAPSVLLYSRVRRQRADNSAIGQPWIFVSGYLAVWLFFSLAAAVTQTMITGPSMALSGRLAPGLVLLTAGLYQLTPLKFSCLRQCRSPVQFLTRHWRPRALGAIRLGALHGAYCVGCCWMLMSLLFVGGVMNLSWVVLLTMIVSAEKMLPHGPLIGRAAGVALVVWGGARLLLG